ncbi:hypothetical protein GCM10009809_39890 [Isoptericola hypogeus]|uniref:Uncharacterized protein n=1 Tax=Isoptericola hypogeus TaxID=300179 RepID=A0ABN2JW18_9MICO
MTVIRGNAKSGVALTRANDGRFQVLAGDEILVETRVESLAMITYDEAVRERDPAREARERERAAFDIHSARWEEFGARSTKNHGRGGRGGRGGV